jgi:hypothetical protein
MKPLRKLFALALLAVSVLLVLAGCSSPPPSVDTSVDTAVVGVPIGPDGLQTNGLMPPLVTCCPGSNCCDPSCVYDDTIDSSVNVPATLSVSGNVLSIPGHRVGNRNAPACTNQRVDAQDAPVAIFNAMSRDLPMGWGTNTCKRTERRCSGWWLWQSCWDECVEWKTRWEEVREGTSDYVSNTNLASGTLGANAVQPAWDRRSSTSCWQSCFLWWCWTDCATNTWNELSCDRNRYEGWNANFGTFTSYAASYMGTLWNKGTAPVWGNPVQWSLQNAYNRAREYQRANPTHTVAVNLVADDYPYGCGNDFWGAVNETYNAFVQWPRVQTNVIGLGGLYSYWYMAYYGFGVQYYMDPAASVRSDTLQAMNYARAWSDKWQYLIAQPSTGEPIDMNTFRFYLKQGTNEYQLYRFPDRWSCNWNDGYWIDYPEGTSGRLRTNLCPRTELWAQQARPTGFATYDCIVERDAEATYVRTGDFDLTKCNAAQLKARALRFDWQSTLPWNSYVRFRLQFSNRQADLASAPAYDYYATSWSGNANGWADLSSITNPPNYQWARLTATLYASSDTYHQYTPRVSGWDLTFTCVDAF